MNQEAIGHMEDREIVALFWSRDQRALRETERKYGTRCRGIAGDILNSYEDAEECVSDAYMAAWNAIPPARPACFKAYIFRAVRNISVNRLKERIAAKRGGGELEAAIDELEGSLASGSSVEGEYDAKELAEAINAFLCTLSKDERLIFMNRYWLTLPTREIAQKLGFKESRVRTSLSRSRDKLRRHLKKEGLL